MFFVNTLRNTEMRFLVINSILIQFFDCSTRRNYLYIYIYLKLQERFMLQLYTRKIRTLTLCISDVKQHQLQLETVVPTLSRTKVVCIESGNKAWEQRRLESQQREKGNTYERECDLTLQKRDACAARVHIHWVHMVPEATGHQLF
ncbi:hypothetical protein ANTPLA_LOCUS1679 [Anthophora plagiata]